MAPDTEDTGPGYVEKVEDIHWILIPGRPASWRARSRPAKANKTRYMNLIGDTASTIFDSPLIGSVELRIYHFHKGTDIDLDNMEKPIMDALTGIAYEDDLQVSRKNTERIRLGASTTISGVTTSLIPTALSENKECIVIGVSKAT